MKRTEQAPEAAREQAATAVSSGALRAAIVIPAYRPGEELIKLLGALSHIGSPPIVLVDDGSGPDFRDLFERAVEFPGVYLVRHAVNLGKGAALKTGINYALCTFPELDAVVTADADGQHDPEDIRRVVETMAACPDRVVLGSRTFGAGVPFRSRVGNVVTRTVMHAMMGRRLADTQTGLRGIPAVLLPHLLRLETNGYDFELDALVTFEQQGVGITEVPIRTIYNPKNSSSHFNPLADSMKIYFVLLRSASVSILTAALDMLVFYLAFRRSGQLAESQFLGRILAVAFNYFMVRRTVFFSQLRHLSVLPKYVLLVCLSACASYAGIRMVTATFGIAVVPAKGLVESLLFFANFAIQRDFIFGKAGAADRAKRSGNNWKLPKFRLRMQSVVAAAAMVLFSVFLFGFVAQRMWVKPGWTPVGFRRLLHYTELFWAVSLPIVLFLPSAFAPILAALFLVATAAALGPLALGAVLLFLMGAWALGSKLLGSGSESSAGRDCCAVLLGIAAYIFLMTFLARLPVNYPAVYVALLAIPIAWNFRHARRRVADWGRALIERRPRARLPAASLALLVFVLGMHWLIVPQPESSADGLAMHLAIPANISLHHALTYRPDRIFWSAMPMGADWCYTLVYVLGGEFAARLLNFAMLLLAEVLLYRLVRRFVSPAIGLLILALFASTSLVQLVTGSLFVENFLAAMVMGLAAALVHFDRAGERRFLYLAAVLAGTALAIKFGALAYVPATVGVAGFVARRHWRKLGERPAVTFATAIVLLLVAALPSYLISWRLTGDPLFPFLNRTFPSPLVDRSINFVDTRFSQPLSSHTFYDLTFHTDRYFEGDPGSLGFGYLLLAPLGIIGLFATRRPSAIIAAIISLAGMLLTLKFLPNVRYLYPGLPLALAPFAALMGWLEPGRLRRVLVSLTVGCVCLNAGFLAASNSYHRDFYERAPLSRAARQTYLHDNAPMREIGQYMNRTHPGAPVLLAYGSDLAAFDAEVYASGWHQFGVYTRLNQARTEQEMGGILRGWKVHYVAAPKPDSPFAINPQPLRQLITECTTPEYQTKYFYLARLEDDCVPAKHAPLTAASGLYDDTDPAIVFEGPWIRDKSWPHAHAHTLTYTNLPGSTIQLAFDGRLLSYIYTKAMNRGMAEFSVDGVQKAIVDLYSADTKWESRTILKVERGHHLATITVLPDKNPKSADRFVDLDSFQVQ